MNKKLIIAIDGPSGAGKSTLSKALAKQLDYLNIDTGAMYRSVAWLSQQRGIDPHDGAALKALCAEMSIEFIRGDISERVFVNGVDVSDAIRTPEISLLVPQVAACPAVREAMLQSQRNLGEVGGVVLEGRDIGTVVFPQADVKFFLSATAAERGRRRYEELQAKGIDVDLQQTIAEVEARDAADTARTLAPLMQADDAIVVDSTQLSIEAVLRKMLIVVKGKEAKSVD
ncbi:MAG: (d)CMP kinase [Desulfuromusa sp.]|nr:(d)CMP kinase [Desulfuromusa sp.]